MALSSAPVISATHAAWQRQMLCDRRADLRGVAVRGLPAANDKIRSAQHGDALRECIRSRENVRSGKLAVGQDDRVVRSHRVGVAHHFLRLRRAHGQHSDRAAQFFAKLKRRLQCKQIIRIGAGIARKALHRAGFRINIDLCARRDLFHANNNFQSCFPSSPVVPATPACALFLFISQKRLPSL